MRADLRFYEAAAKAAAMPSGSVLTLEKKLEMADMPSLTDFAKTYSDFTCGFASFFDGTSFEFTGS